ncbi:MAG: hypothetical protein HZB29_10565 [Nitrospinae bacterium]|nr:hypothetical protein [Nitrospinota bacterium]
MGDLFGKMRDQAKAAEKLRHEKHEREKSAHGHDAGESMTASVAKFTGLPAEEVEYCCGSICPHCQVFLDKAIALIELGYPHHLFMNPAQEEVFNEAIELFRKDRTLYMLRKQELMDKMRR